MQSQQLNWLQPQQKRPIQWYHGLYIVLLKEIPVAPPVAYLRCVQRHHMGALPFRTVKQLKLLLKFSLQIFTR